MVKSDSKKYSIILCVILAIIAAMVLRQIEADAPLNNVFDILRASIYIGMFISWGASIHRRIVQPQVSRYLIDLSRCFEESFINLELLGVDCLQTLPSGISMATKDMLRVYHSFELVMEACLYDLSHVWLHMRNRENRFLLNMEFVCDTNLSTFAHVADAFTFEDGVYRCLLF